MCPYCGHMNAGAASCDRCHGLFEPLSRQASQNSMGPWFIRDEANPFLPGCSLHTLRVLIRRGKVTRDTILRGPSTRQFWTFARNAPGIGNLLGECHACHADASPEDARCGACGASFEVIADRERLGLSDVRLLPGHAAPEQIAAASVPADRLGDGQPANRRKPEGAEKPLVGVDDPAEAQAFIAARQRQRRSRRRNMIAIVGALLAIGILGAGVWVVANLGPENTPRQNAISVLNPNKTGGAASSESGTAAKNAEASEEGPVTSPPAEPDPTQAGEGREIEDLVRELESSDLSKVRAAMADPRLSGIKSDSRIAATLRMAEERIRIAEFEGRL